MGSGEAGGNAWFSLCPDIVNVLRLLRLVACALATYDEALALGKQRKVGMRDGEREMVAPKAMCVTIQLPRVSRGRPWGTVRIYKLTRLQLCCVCSDETTPEKLEPLDVL